MSRWLSRYWFLFPLLVLVVIVVDRVEEPTDVAIEDTIDMRQTQSDYYLSGFTTRKFNISGQIEYVIRGSALAHYPDDDRSEISAPQLELYRAGSTWFVRSRAGRFDTDPDLFKLTGDVVLERNSDQADPIVIKTQSLTIETDANKVNTSEKIEIVAATWKVQATGLSSTIDDGKLQLHSDVTGRYEMPDPSRQD